MNSWYHYLRASYLPNETQLLMQDIFKVQDYFISFLPLKILKFTEDMKDILIQSGIINYSRIYAVDRNL